MQLQQLRYFVAVANQRHFTRAAERLGVTQPSLSKQIHTLEADLGAPLFGRVRANITLTPAGEALLPLAERILADVDTARREVEEVIGVRRGRVRLGATPSLCTSLVPAVLRRYRDAHPDIELHIEESGSQDLVRNLTRGELDLALIVLPEHGTDPALRVAPLLRESLVVAAAEASQDGPAAAQLRITDLRDQPVLMFRSGYDLRDATLEACRREGFVPEFAVEGGEMDSVLGFVAAGLGVALVPSMALANRPLLRAIPLAPPGVQRTIALATRHEPTPTHAAQALHDILLAYLDEMFATNALPAGVVPA